MRFIVLFFVYILFFGVFSIKVKFVDGFTVNLIGWPELIWTEKSDDT